MNAVSLMESTLTSLLHCLNVHIAFGPSEVVWLSTDDEGSDWTRRAADNMVVEEMKDADWLMDEKQVQRFHLENKSNLISSFKETAVTKKKDQSLISFQTLIGTKSSVTSQIHIFKIKKNIYVYMLKKNPQGSW